MPQNHSFIIAIDGYSSCGKSTLAKQIAKKFNFVYVDTGAMYRATTLFFIQNNINLNDDLEVENALNNINISFENIAGQNTTFLNSVNVESKIRDLSVSSKVSEVAQISAVRRKMVSLQKNMLAYPGLVMDGRDIGTVVFPNAHIKLFVTADPKIRAQRRYQELISKGENVSLKEIEDNIQHRDTIDTQRKDSPLLIADDAISIDNSNMTIQEQFELAVSYIEKVMESH